MKKLSQLFRVACALFSIPASAQLYLGGGVGLTDPAGDSKTSNFYELHAGFRIIENLALEIGFSDFGVIEARSGGGEAELETYTYSVLGILPVRENHEVFFKFGQHNWKADVASPVEGLSEVAGNIDDDDFLYGLGYSALFTSGEGAAQISLTRYDVLESEVDVLSVGLEVRF